MNQITAIIDNTVLANFMDSGQIGILNSSNLIFKTLFVPEAVHYEFLNVKGKLLHARTRFSDGIKIDKGYYRHCNTYDPIILGSFSRKDGVDPGEAEAISQAAKRGISIIITDDRKCRDYIEKKFAHIKTYSTLTIIALLDLSGWLPDRNKNFQQLYMSCSFTAAQLRVAYIQASQHIGITLKGKALSKKSSLKSIIGKRKPSKAIR